LDNMLSSVRLRTLSQSVVSGQRTLSFSKERTQFQNKLSDLRKGWISDIQEKMTQQEDVIKAERHEIVIKKAIKLRDHSTQSAIRAATHKKIAEESLLRYKAKLAASQIVEADKLEAQRKRYHMAVADLEDEKKHWITKDNMETKITEDLFATPATTGLTNKYSDLWRYHCFAIDLDRLMAMEKNPKSAMEWRKQMRADHNLDKKLQVAEYLNTIVGTGADREKFKEFVDEYTDAIQARGDFKDQDDSLEEELYATDQMNRYEETIEAEDDEEMENLPEGVMGKKKDGRKLTSFRMARKH